MYGYRAVHTHSALDTARTPHKQLNMEREIREKIWGFNPFPLPGISPPHALLARDRPAAPQAAPVVAR